MLAIQCPICHTQITVKNARPNEKVLCPACGQATAVHASAPPVLMGDWVLTPMSESSGAAGVQSSKSGVSDPPTHPPLGEPDVTITIDTHVPDQDASLTDFLDPPEADGELGRLGTNRILKILGRGGMGVVYQAEDSKLKRAVAIKAMLPTLAASSSAVKRFLREAQAMAAVEHDHIVRIYQVDEHRGVPYLAMEFLKGEPLEARLQRGAELPNSEVVRIGREIAEALDAAHTAGLIHRDVKPSNIWLENRRGRVKILDFGLARALSPDSRLTQLGVIVGTPSYMSPEQAHGDTVDTRCDLFSLGVVLYRLCTGELPFQGDDTVTRLQAVATHHPTPPIKIKFDLPSSLSELVMKLLEKDPARRIASAKEVMLALEKVQTLAR